MNGLYLLPGVGLFWAFADKDGHTVASLRLPRLGAEGRKVLLRRFARHHGLCVVAWGTTPGYSPDCVRASMKAVPGVRAGSDLTLMAACC